MKTNIKSLFYILLTLLFLSAGEAKADELVRYNIGESTSARTIIRHYQEGEDIACYHGSSRPFFIMYKAGVAITNVIYPTNIDTIFDFEIYNDTIYFCGKRNSSVTGGAVVGYFDISYFYSATAANIAYINLPVMDHVKAIEVGWFAMRKHVVGIGEDIEEKNMIVDMIDETTHWKVNSSEMGRDTVLLSDLIITDSFVVVTATKKGTVPTGYLWYITKPVAPSQSLFPCYATYQNHPNAINTKYLIRNMVGGSFVTARHASSNNNIILSYYNGSSYVRSIYLNDLSKGKFILQDMKREPGVWTVEILTSGTYTNFPNVSFMSKIHEVPNDDPIPLTIYTHIYDKVNLQSLDRVWASNYNVGEGHFVLSGLDVSSGYGTPYYIKFQHQRFNGSCLSKSSIFATNTTVEHTQQYDFFMSNTQTLQLPEVFASDRKETLVYTKCQSYSQTDENE
jgi:hypothetical protein